MNKKEIIKMLEAVIDEIEDEEEETIPEILCSDNEWKNSARSIEEVKNGTFIYENEKYIYYAELRNNWLYRIKR